MRTIIQGVKESSVSVHGHIVGNIGKGILVLLGINRQDDEKDADYLSDKIINLRIFEDENGKIRFIADFIASSIFAISPSTADRSKNKISPDC